MVLTESEFSAMILFLVLISSLSGCYLFLSPLFVWFSPSLFCSLCFQESLALVLPGISCMHGIDWKWLLHLGTSPCLAVDTFLTRQNPCLQWTPHYNWTLGFKFRPTCNLAHFCWAPACSSQQQIGCTFSFNWIWQQHYQNRFRIRNHQVRSASQSSVLNQHPQVRISVAESASKTILEQHRG